MLRVGFAYLLGLVYVLQLLGPKITALVQHLGLPLCMAVWVGTRFAMHQVTEYLQVHSLIEMKQDLFLPLSGSRALVVSTYNILEWVSAGSASHRRFGLA